MNRLNLVLPAAGLGSRFQQVGEVRPKPLIPVFGIPMIAWVLLNFPLENVDKIWIISQRKDAIPEALNDLTSKFPFEIGFLEIDGLTEGPASTVNLVLETLPDSDGVIVANTDQFVFSDLAPFVEIVRSGRSQGQIVTMRASSNAWSYVGRDSSGLINQVVEKIEISNEATVGIYGWSNARDAKNAFLNTFELDIRTNNEFYVAPTYNFMLEQQKIVETYLVGDHGTAVHGLGTPKDLIAFLDLPEAQMAALNFTKILKFNNS
jgi:NDP-sugar pyrophosphorylase family protein